MARLASDVNKGFYATSKETVKKIIDKLVAFKEDAETVAIDACAGEGEIINTLSTDYGCKSYAVELDQFRAQITSKLNVVKTLNTDAIYGVSKNTFWAGLNFLNPPYGVDSEGKRLELKFLQSWGSVTSKGGLLILVINPSSLNKDLVDTLRKQGYQLKLSVYDKDNDDYKNFNQFFMLLQRINLNFREKEDLLLGAFENAVEIGELHDNFPKIEITTGGAPQYFREFIIPKWKMDEKMNQSTLERTFKNEIASQDFLRSAITQPNEGQAAQLIASGIINKTVRVEIDGKMHDIETKGTVIKYEKESSKEDAEGNTVGVKVSDAYKTEVWLLSRTTGEYMKAN